MEGTVSGIQTYFKKFASGFEPIPPIRIILPVQSKIHATHLNSTVLG